MYLSLFGGKWMKRFIKKVSYFSALIFTLTYASSLCSEEAFFGETAVAAYSKGKNGKYSSGKYEGIDSWTPYFTSIANVEDIEQKIFVQGTVGIGFLYLTRVQANMKVIPSPRNSAMNGAVPKNVGGFSYNRTPLSDLMFGYRFLDWLKLALALQNQNNIHFQSRFAPSLVPAGSTRTSNTSLPETQFRANLALNSVYLKVMFELPWVMVLKSWMYALYFNVGVGPCWQSWTDLRQYVQFTNNNNSVNTTFVNTLKQKYGASALWQLDTGIRIKPASTQTYISLILGFKFNSWGKVPNLGAQSQQGSWGFSFQKPYSARMLYSFAPYLGIQCNF